MEPEQEPQDKRQPNISPQETSQDQIMRLKDEQLNCLPVHEPKFPEQCKYPQLKQQIALRQQQQLLNQQQKAKPTYRSRYLQSIQQIEDILNTRVYKKYLNQQNSITFQNIIQTFSPYVFQKPSQAQNPNLVISLNWFGLQFLAQAFKDSNFNDLIQNNMIFHARIACIVYALGYGSKQMIKNYNIVFDEKLQKLHQYLVKNGLMYSFDEKIWTDRPKKSMYQSYSHKPNIDDLQQWRRQCEQSHEQFKLIHQFLKRLNFTDKNHQFNKRMSKLVDENYQSRYIQDLGFYSFKNKQQVIQFKERQRSYIFSNILFYCDIIKASYSRLYLSEMHRKKQLDYRWLQETHDYIQWMFPNHFKSNFNGDSYPMNYVQAQIFKTDQQLGKKIKKSFQIYLNFIGCKILSDNQGQKSQLQIVYGTAKQQLRRMDDALIKYTHNHLRVMRILACLSIVGFRNLAQSFLNLFNKLALPDQPYGNKRVFTNALQTKWRVYGSQTEEQKKKAIEMCFVPDQQFSCHISIERLRIKTQLVDDSVREKALNSFKEVQQEQNKGSCQKICSVV